MYSKLSALSVLVAFCCATAGAISSYTSTFYCQQWARKLGDALPDDLSIEPVGDGDWFAHNFSKEPIQFSEDKQYVFVPGHSRMRVSEGGTWRGKKTGKYYRADDCAAEHDSVFWFNGRSYPGRTLTYHHHFCFLLRQDGSAFYNFALLTNTDNPEMNSSWKVYSGILSR